MPFEKRPKVFVSSTIYDFQDMRGALKFWLEELGYEVLTSELNDFPKDLDHNSYQACLAAIDASDYFLLLNGNRVGGWYDEANKISITRKEYRQAFAQFEKHGKPRLILFVRQNVWDIREDRKALAKYLQNEEPSLSPEQRKMIASHPTKFADDADAIFSFISEIGQVDVMKAAISGSRSLPPANWIHRFETFRDIIDALRGAFGASRHTERQLLLSNLKLELCRNLGSLLHRPKGSSELIQIASLGMDATQQIKGGYDDSSDMESRDLARLDVFLLLGRGRSNTLSTLFLSEAVRTGVFMEYSTQKRTYVQTDAHVHFQELLMLIGDLRRFEGRADAAQDTVFHDKIRALTKGKQRVQIQNQEIARACANAKLMHRVGELHIRCIGFLNAKPEALKNVAPWSISVLPTETPKIAAEVVTIADAEAWSLSQKLD